MSAFRRFAADLFKGIGNVHWDLGRIMGALSMTPIFGALLWNMHLGQPIDILALGGGIAAVMGAAAALIAAKDLANPANRAPSKVSVEGDLSAENVETVEVAK